MNDQSTSASASNEELLRLFWKQLDYEGASDEGTLSQQEAARRIVAAAGPAREAVLLAAAFADEFRLALPTLADALEHPSEEMLLVTPLRPTGSMLVAATAVRQGQLHQDEGDLRGAEHFFRWATQQFHERGEQSAESLALTLLGRVVQMQDRLDEATQCYQEALTIDRAVGDHFNEGVDLGLLSQVAWLSGRLDDAERFARQALPIHRRYRDGANAASTLATLGAVAQARGQHWQAKLYVLRSKLAR